MSSIVDQTIITILGRTPPVERDRAVELFHHVDEYEPADCYPITHADITDDSSTEPENMVVFFGDHVPDESDIMKANPNQFVARYDDGRVGFMVRSFLRSVDDFIDCLEHVLTATDIHIETDDEEAPPGFQVLFVLPTGVSTDDVIPPSGWVLERDDGDSATRLWLHPTDPFVLDGSVSPLRERLGAIREVPEQVTAEIPSPTGERPADPVEEFYTIRSHPELETDEDVELFVRLLAHSEGLLAKADNLRWEKGTVVSLDTTVVEESLDESTVKTWVEDRHDMQRILSPKTVADSTADSETALVEADAVLERDGKQQTEQREYLVATEDGDWKLLG